MGCCISSPSFVAGYSEKELYAKLHQQHDAKFGPKEPSKVARNDALKVAPAPKHDAKVSPDPGSGPRDAQVKPKGCRKLTVTSRKMHVDTAILRALLHGWNIGEDCVELRLLEDGAELPDAAASLKPSPHSIHSLLVGGVTHHGTLEMVTEKIACEWAEAEGVCSVDPRIMCLVQIVRFYFGDQASLLAPLSIHRECASAMASIDKDFGSDAFLMQPEAFSVNGAYLASCAPFITILCESQLLPSLKEFPGLTAFFVRSERLEGVRFWKTGSKARLEAFFLAKREEARAAAASALIKLQHDAILSLLKEFSRAVKLESVQGDAAKEKLMNIQAGFNRLHDVLLEHEAMEDQHLFPEIDRAKVGSAESLHGGCKDETPITNGILQDIKMAISVSHDSRGLDRLMGSLQEKAEHLLGLLELHFTTEERIVMPIMKRLVQRDSHGMWPKSIVASMQLSHGQLACFMLSTLSRQDRAKYSAAMEVAAEGLDIDEAWPAFAAAVTAVEDETGRMQFIR